MRPERVLRTSVNRKRGACFCRGSFYSLLPGSGETGSSFSIDQGVVGVIGAICYEISIDCLSGFSRVFFGTTLNEDKRRCTALLWTD